MAKSRQTEWILDVVESVPSLVFIALVRNNVELEMAGWTGSALALAVLVGFRVFRVTHNPILFGINLHLLLITPVIVALFAFGDRTWAQFLAARPGESLFIVMFLCGCYLTMLSPRGFVGTDGMEPRDRYINSAVLLAATIAAFLWSGANSGNMFVSIGIPVALLFGLRRLLLARWFDRNADKFGVAALGGGAGADQTTTEDWQAI